MDSGVLVCALVEMLFLLAVLMGPPLIADPAREFGKDWNFDLGKAPEVGGRKVGVEPMRNLPKYGYAREYFVTGSRTCGWKG
jgi:hypothetical protein